MQQSNRFQQQGFSLIELAVTMVVFGLFFSVLTYVIFGMNTALHGSKGGKSDDQSLIVAGFSDGSQATIKKTLLFFVKNNHRLPCPDTNQDGWEDCAAGNHVGILPYLNLGYAAPLKDSRNNDVRYGVYRNSTDNADLTVNKNRFAPVLPGNPPGDPATVVTTANTPDFCKALENAWATGTNNAAYIHTSDGTNIRNAAYILAIGGQRDADSNGSFFDGKNSSGVDFEISGKAEDASYDDLVGSQTFLDLYQLLNCTVRIAEVNGAALDAQLAEVAAIAAATSVANGEADLDGAKRAVMEGEIDVAVAGIKILNATFSMLAAATGMSAKSVPDIANFAVAVAALAKAIADKIIAEDRLEEFEATEAEAQSRLDTYKTRKTAADTHAKDRLDFAKTVETNGGLK